MKKLTVYSKSRGLRTLKPGITLEQYQTKYPDAIKCCKPSFSRLEQWEENGTSRTPCGCTVEPDGHCNHGNPSWLLIMGMI